MKNRARLRERWGVLPALEHKELHHEERVSVGSSALGALVVVEALDDGSGRPPSP